MRQDFDSLEEIRPLLLSNLPSRLDDAAHNRCLQQALAAVSAAKGDFSRLAAAPNRRQ